MRKEPFHRGTDHLAMFKEQEAGAPKYVATYKNMGESWHRRILVSVSI